MVHVFSFIFMFIHARSHGLFLYFFSCHILCMTSFQYSLKMHPYSIMFYKHFYSTPHLSTHTFQFHDAVYREIFTPFFFIPLALVASRQIEICVNSNLKWFTYQKEYQIYTTVSGQIQDGAKLFATVGGWKNMGQK